MENKKQQLEQLKIRLKKAYSLPKDEQDKWQKQINDIEDQISEIENELGISTVDQLGELLIKAFNKIASLNWEEFSYDSFFKIYPEIGKKFSQIENKLNRLLNGTGGLTVFEHTLKEYIKIYVEINSILQHESKNEIYKQMGFEEVMPGTKDYDEMTEVMKSWDNKEESAN